MKAGFPWIFLEADKCSSFNVLKKQRRRLAKNKLLLVGEVSMRTVCLRHKLANRCKVPSVSLVIVPNTPSAFIWILHQEAITYHCFQAGRRKSFVSGIPKVRLNTAKTQGNILTQNIKCFWKEDLVFHSVLQEFSKLPNTFKLLCQGLFKYLKAIWQNCLQAD